MQSRLVLTLLALLELGYAGICALLYFKQRDLIYFPAATAVPMHATDFSLARDGSTLRGWQLNPGKQRALIYFGGNAEEVTEYAGSVREPYGERAVLLVNYRGYGGSGGSPTEKALVADAAEVYDWAARRPDVDPARIALHGRSLGSGVAVQLAAARPARCVILTSPFASALDVARSAYPWLPVALLLRHPFDSLAHAPRLAIPALFLIGEGDTLVPPEHSERLAAAWAGPVEKLRVPGGHNDLSVQPGYDAAIRAFLERHLA